MTIKEVEKRLNISRANIRFYEKEGLLLPKRNDNEYRDYSEEDVKRLEIIILFRKCNISIYDIRLLLSNSKSMEDVFKKQVNVIENEMKQLEGAKNLCRRLSKDKTTIDNIDVSKYFDIVKKEEDEGNMFYNITEDYILAREKLYQSIIENKEFKGGDMMKNSIKIGIYVISFLLTMLFMILFDYIFNNKIDLDDIICFSAIMMIIDIVGVKKYIENKSKKKFTTKDNIKHYIIIIVMMVICLGGYSITRNVIDINRDPKDNILEMSIKKSIIDIANVKYINDNNYIYAEAHKIIDYEVIDNEIYVYLVTNYGIYNSNCDVIEDSKDILTLVYDKKKNKNGIYSLNKYIEGSIPNNLKDKTNVNYNDSYFTDQIKNYCNN